MPSSWHQPSLILSTFHHGSTVITRSCLITPCRQSKLSKEHATKDRFGRTISTISTTSWGTKSRGNIRKAPINIPASLLIPYLLPSPHSYHNHNISTCHHVLPTDLRWVSRREDCHRVLATPGGPDQFSRPGRPVSIRPVCVDCVTLSACLGLVLILIDYPSKITRLTEGEPSLFSSISWETWRHMTRLSGLHPRTKSTGMSCSNRGLLRKQHRLMCKTGVRSTATPFSEAKVSGNAPWLFYP